MTSEMTTTAKPHVGTGRAADERFGTHVVLWIVEDAEAWAAAIEAEGDAEPGKWPKSSRHIGEFRRQERHESAARVRAQGPRRTVRGTHFSIASADAKVAGLYRAHPNPGVRYEAAEITDVGACPDCHRPTIHADGRRWHHTGGFPAECAPRPKPKPDTPERQDGEWEIGTRGYMTCGYCNKTESWAQVIIGYWELTGYHMLGIEVATGELVVLAEATTLTGGHVTLPHHCKEIPDSVRAEYQKEIAAILAENETAPAPGKPSAPRSPKGLP